MIVFDLTVYNGVVNSFGELIRFCEGGVVDNGSRVEDGNVREESGLEKAAAIEVLTLGRERSDLANCGFEG